MSFGEDEPRLVCWTHEWIFVSVSSGNCFWSLDKSRFMKSWNFNELSPKATAWKELHGRRRFCYAHVSSFHSKTTNVRPWKALWQRFPLTIPNWINLEFWISTSFFFFLHKTFLMLSQVQCSRLVKLFICKRSDSLSSF